MQYNYVILFGRRKMSISEDVMHPAGIQSSRNVWIRFWTFYISAGFHLTWLYDPIFRL